jgi:NADPH2:quinone reductase
MLQSAARIFKLVEAGALSVEIHQTYGLDQVAQAHRDLESRATTGCSLILP